MIKSIIVENDHESVNMLLSLLAEHFPEIKVGAICSTFESAVSKINEYAPDLVFLDIELDSEKTGFDVIRYTQNLNYHVIFTSSYNKYLLEAIKFLFISYLLKPFELEDLQTAINWYKQISHDTTKDQKEALIQNLEQHDKHALKFGIPTTAGLEFTSINDIVYCKAKDSYTEFVMSNGQKKLASKSLKNYDETLSPKGFYRIHDSFLINLDHMQKILKTGKEGGTVELSNKILLPISRHKKEGFMNYLTLHRIILKKTS